MNTFYTQRCYVGNTNRGVNSTVCMTNEEKVKMVSSVYSNVKKLTIAQMILAKPMITSEEIITATGYPADSVSKMLSDMVKRGIIIMQTGEDRRIKPLTLTNLGEKLLRL
jgi:DNA-binding MarR family transcriptional regulator